MDTERNHSDAPTGVLSKFERHENLQAGKRICRNKSEEMKGFGPRFEMEDGLLTRPNECIKEENLHGSEVKDLSTSDFPPSAIERGIKAFGAGVYGIEISIYSYK